MPAAYFPPSVLQNGLKMTTEPPKGLKANLKRTYNTLITEETYEALHRKPDNALQNSDIGDDAGEGAGEVLDGGANGRAQSEAGESEDGFDNTAAWKKLLFGLSFFHAVIQERRKYGPLGWNIRYEFNDSDLRTSIKMLEGFLRGSEDIPWESMHYMTGQINYGGRVTDDWDRVLLMSLLTKFFSIDVVEDEEYEDGYKFSASGTYFVPEHETIEEIRDYIDKLPWTEEPEVFGMHGNASITYQKNETDSMFGTILSIQPRESGGGDGKSSDEIVIELAATLEGQIPEMLLKEECAKNLFLETDGLMQCLSTVLI